VVTVGWQAVWMLGAGSLIMIAPALSHLARRAERSPLDPEPRSAQTGQDKTRQEVLRDARFYLLVPAAILPAFVVTGVFFHQARLVEEKDWTLGWFAGMFVVFAA